MLKRVLIHYLKDLNAFFQVAYRLIQKEVVRRHSSQVVIESLKEVGFHEIKEITLWEQDRFIPIRSICKEERDIVFCMN